MPRARSRDSGRTRSPLWWPPGTRTRRRPPRLPVLREPATCALRSCAGRLGPGPDGIGCARDRARSALLEIRHSRLAEGLRPDVCDASLHRPAQGRDEAERLTRERPKTQTGTDDGEHLRQTLAVDLLAVSGGDAKEHAELVQGQDREVRARDEDRDSEHAVLAGGGPRDGLADRGGG